jgi:hypothetical protein
MKPPRTPLFGIPDVVIHRADESVVKVHANYGAAKAGDIESAKALVSSFVNDSGIERLKRLIGGRFPELVPIHALEAEGVSVGHTGASGFARLAHQARFDGEIERGSLYLVVDDFVGQGGTLANLSVSISTALPGRKLITSKEPRMLTQSEVDLLRLMMLITPCGSLDFELMILRYWSNRTHRRYYPAP